MSRQGRNRSQRSGLVGQSCVPPGGGGDRATRHLATGTMPRTILCQKCGIVLNLPDRGHCGQADEVSQVWPRFAVRREGCQFPSTLPGPADADLASSRDLGRRPPSHPELPVLLADRDLRDVFDLPTGTAAEIEHSAVAERKPTVSDAEALFHEEPVRKKKQRGRKLRRSPLPDLRRRRRGGHVDLPLVRRGPGNRHAGRPAGRSAPPPSATIDGSADSHRRHRTSLRDGLGDSLVLSLIQSVRGARRRAVRLALPGLVSAVGIYGAIEFYIGKSPKYLMLALTLGVFVDLVSLIALPIVQANFRKTRVVVRPRT